MDIKALAKEQLGSFTDDLKGRLKEDYDKLTDEQKDAATRAAKRLIELELRKTKGEDVSEDLAFVKVTVAEFVVACELSVANAFKEAFWTALEKVAKVAVEVLLASFKTGL